MLHGSESRISIGIYGLLNVKKITFYNKKANRARKDLTFVPGDEIMDLNNERRSLKKNVSLKSGNGSVLVIDPTN